MHILSNPGRPIDWPSPYSRAGRILGWVHYLATAALASACALGWWASWGLGFVLGLALGVAAIAGALPVVALYILGRFLRGRFDLLAAANRYQ